MVVVASVVVVAAVVDASVVVALAVVVAAVVDASVIVALVVVASAVVVAAVDASVVVASAVVVAAVVDDPGLSKVQLTFMAKSQYIPLNSNPSGQVTVSTRSPFSQNT